MTDRLISRPIQILLVEDNHVDIRLTEEAFAECKLRNKLMVATKAEDALAMLRQEAPYQDSPRPDIILLDLNLPGMHGNELLTIIKDDPELRVIPVVILSSSQANEDIVAAYKAHANCFISKPVDMLQFTNIVQNIDTFWFSIVKLPSD